MTWRRVRWLAGAAAFGVVMAAGRAEPAPAVSSASAANAAPCPTGLPANTRCLSGRDELGAGYWIALPEP